MQRWPVTREDVIRCLKLVFFTHAVVESPLYLLLPVYMDKTGTPFNYDTIPPWYNRFATDGFPVFATDGLFGCCCLGLAVGTRTCGSWLWRL